MEVPDLISPEVWELAKQAFEQEQYYVAYNNTLLFVHPDDIRFFNNMEDAADFSSENVGDYDAWNVLRFTSLDQFKTHIEGIVPGIVFDPVAIAAEPQQTFFPVKELQSKTTIIMDIQKTLQQLSNKLLFLGFGEGLNTELERQIKEGKPEFSLNASTEFAGDKMEAVLNFKYGEKNGMENYFLNNYVATLASNENKPSQFFYVNNRGQSITFKEACNLLNDRFVFKTLTTKTGAEYDTWIKIDKDNIDLKTGYPKLHQYGDRLGFDLKEAVNRMPFKFLKYGPELTSVLKSLEKGNKAQVVLLNEKDEQKVFIEANPPSLTLNMYDKDGNKIDFPAQKVELKYAKVEEVAVEENQGRYNKKDLLAKKREPNNLIEKKGNAKRGPRKKIQ
jgi:hypothetical protein